jgi:hypothetical protein
MLILAYQYFEQYEPVILEISKVVQQNSSWGKKGNNGMLILKIVQMLPFLNI